MNIRADVIWALRGQGGGLTLFEIASRIASQRKQKYGDHKILNVLDILMQGGQVEKSESTGRVTYRWIAAATE